MAEYIEREKAIAICQNYYEYCLKMHDFSGDSIAYDIRTNIQGLPIADVVPVVRCRDCKYATTIKDYDILQDYIWCFRHGNKVIHINNYCSFAMRRELDDK